MREYLLNDIREIECGYVGNKSGRGRKQKATPEQIEKWNRDRRKKAVRLLIEANFTKGDPWVCLKYRKGTRKSIKEVSKDLSLFCRKMRIAYKKNKQVFRWIARIEVGRLGGLHVHLICNSFKGDNLSLITETWEAVSSEASRADVQGLDGNADREQIAEYVTKEAEIDDDQYHLPGTIEAKRTAFKIRSSRNLERPEPKKTIISKRFMQKLMMDGPKPAEGYSIIPDSVKRGENPITGTPFIRWREIRVKPVTETLSGNQKADERALKERSKNGKEALLTRETAPKKRKPQKSALKKGGILQKVHKALNSIKARILKCR